jgi:hypothetical protein
MHPHWPPASPEIQRKLLSLFIQSLAHKNTAPPFSPAPQAAVNIVDFYLDDVEPAVSKSTIVSLTMLDEAFVHFWHDALLDPIVSSFPSFVICKLSDARRAIHARGSTLTGLNVLTDAGKPVFVLFHHHHHPCRTPRLRSKSKAVTLPM